MKSILKKSPLAHKGYKLLRDFFKLYATKSYAQEGEDLILKRIFENQNRGFYVDVGAHHPYRFSNTFLFYQRGWRGINIDAMPNSMKLFERFRPQDINLEIPVGQEGQSLEYFSFNEPALNTFNKEAVEKILQKPQYKLLQTYKLKIQSLAKILESHLATNQEIDFMSIDVEGLDLEVLKSNNWSKYRPKLLLVEALGGGDMEEILSSPLYAFLSDQGYKFFAKTFNTLFFQDKER